MAKRLKQFDRWRDELTPGIRVPAPPPKRLRAFLAGVLVGAVLALAVVRVIG